MSKEILLGEIGQRAEEQAKNIVASAQSAAEERLFKVEAELETEYRLKLDRIKAELMNSLSGHKTLFKLDAKKSELCAKREIIDEVYLLAKQKLMKMNDADYLKFTSGIIEKFGEDGDEVIICREDERRITSEWLSGLALDLKLSSNRHSDCGGIILRNKKFDKNLTLSAIMKEAKIDTESYIVERLF